MLERHHLSIIREIHRRGSLTAAADQLCLTQSAVSHSIKRLEQQLGTALWIKSGRRLQFTQAGRYLLQMAERVLPQFENAEAQVQRFAEGQRGTLRIGMECHPCYQWLLQVVAPFLKTWPDVDVDVKQKFQFGGMGALFSFDIDLLVTPDPLYKAGISYLPVFDYELVLVVGREHKLAGESWIEPEQLVDQVLYTYPVESGRLDIFNQFLTPAQCSPRQHKHIETTEIMLQMVAAERGVAVLPKWLAEQYAEEMPICTVALGAEGIDKTINVAVRDSDLEIPYLQGFVEMARSAAVLRGTT